MVATEHQLLVLARLYGSAHGIDLQTVSSRVFNDGKKLAALESGKDITVRRSQSALHWFAEHWPAGVPWPRDVERPE